MTKEDHVQNNFQSFWVKRADLLVAEGEYQIHLKIQFSATLQGFLSVLLI